MLASELQAVDWSRTGSDGPQPAMRRIRGSEGQGGRAVPRGRLRAGGAVGARGFGSLLARAFKAEEMICGETLTSADGRALPGSPDSYFRRYLVMTHGRLAKQKPLGNAVTEPSQPAPGQTLWEAGQPSLSVPG